MRTKGWEDRLRLMDEAMEALRVARRAAGQVDFGRFGWLRAVRRAAELPWLEATKRMGVGESALFRMESAERDGRITLNTLRKAAEGLECELVYGLVPKAGTLRERVAGIEAERARLRAEAYAKKLQKGKDRRRESLKVEYEAKERQLMMAEWVKYWDDPKAMKMLWGRPGGRLRARPFYKAMLAKEMKKLLRKMGIRVRDVETTKPTR